MNIYLFYYSSMKYNIIIILTYRKYRPLIIGFLYKMSIYSLSCSMIYTTWCQFRVKLCYLLRFIKFPISTMSYTEIYVKIDLIRKQCDSFSYWHFIDFRTNITYVSKRKFSNTALNRYFNRCILSC